MPPAHFRVPAAMLLSAAGLTTMAMDLPHTPRAELYPEIEPYSAGILKLDGRHTMYWEQSGNPEGAPVLFLHGGPGAGASPAHRRFFDPAHYRIVIFDQRGAGRSTPLGEVRDNTTPHPRRRHRAAARPPRYRALARVRRLVGQHARARLWRGARRSLHGFRPARHVPVPRERDRVVSLWPEEPLPRGLARFRRTRFRKRSAATSSPPITGG